MEGSSRNKDGSSPKLLDLIQKEREWVVKDGRRFGVAEERELELRLGPPGEDWFINENNTHYSNNNQKFLTSPWGSSTGLSPFHTPSSFHIKTQVQQQQQQQPKPSYLHHQFPSIPKAMESTQACNTKVVADLQQHHSEKKACSQASPSSANTAVNNSSSQKRSAPPVVGWPPVRSFRKNLANSSSSKQAIDSQNGNTSKEEKPKHESFTKGLFIKINMDGVPIGRKVDLKAYDSYQKLSTAVDELFRDLRAAQKDSPAVGNQNKMEDVKEITGLLDGSGEYTLVYEDNEGDRMLVGDVPWEMFVATVKRLRVLKSSELSKLCLGSGKSEKTSVASAR